MTNKQPQQQYAIGMVGLGVMERNLLLNMADPASRWRPVIEVLLVAKTRSV